MNGLSASIDFVCDNPYTYLSAVARRQRSQTGSALDRAITTYDLLPEPELRAQDLLDDVVMIDADALHSHPRWRLDEYFLNDVLTNTEAEEICERFGFTLPQFSPLRLTLRRALDPSQVPNLVPIKASRARTRASDTMKAGIDNLMNAADHLTQTADKMDPIYTGAAKDPEDGKKLDTWRKDLDRVLLDIETLHRQLRFLAPRADIALDVSPTDRRKISDNRRIMILTAIFRFWELTKGKPTITTDPITNQRVGQLVDFSNAIVAKITLPSAILPGETIWRDLKGWRKSQAARTKCRDIE